MEKKDIKNPGAPFGFGDRVMGTKMTEHMSLETYMLSYRYLVIIGGISSADRLNTFLAQSGAVILLQETDFLYHYSAFLKPWVHYGEYPCEKRGVSLPAVHFITLHSNTNMISDDNFFYHRPHHHSIQSLSLTTVPT